MNALVATLSRPLRRLARRSDYDLFRPDCEPGG